MFDERKHFVIQTQVPYFADFFWVLGKKKGVFESLKKNKRFLKQSKKFLEYQKSF